MSLSIQSSRRYNFEILLILINLQKAFDKIDKTCFIADIAVGLDVNTTRSYNQKNDNYLLLLTELLKLYPRYTFEILPIVVGATGLITTELAINLRKLKIKNIEVTADRCQRMALIGTMKIVKSVMNMKNT